MRSVQIDKRGYGRGMMCAQCRRTLKPGDVGLVQNVPRTTRNHARSELWFHRRCLVEVIEKAPLEQNDYVEQYEALQNQLRDGEAII